MARFETGVTRSPRDASEGKWVFSGGIEIPCRYKVLEESTKKSYLRKRVKLGLNDFFNEL